MRISRTSVQAVVVCAVLIGAVLVPQTAVAQYDPTKPPAQPRLCDASFENCRTQIIDLINKESQTIDVAFWFMDDDRFAIALANAKGRGVRVRVLFDTEGVVGSTRQAIIDRMKNAGIPMRSKSSGGILHWKMMAFGGQHIVNFSAANFSGYAYVPVQPYVEYVDEVVVFTTEAALVNTFLTKYDDVWTSTSGFVNYANVTTLQRHHPTSPLDSRLNFPPTQNYATRAVARYDAETVGIDVTMYRITDRRHTDAMIRAVRRGVPVRLYTEPHQYRDPTRLWHAFNVDLAYISGVKVKHRAHAGLNHQKTVILHGQRMVIHGSSNWTSPSANSQLEHNLFTTDSSYYTYFVNQFNRKWNNSRGYTETSDFVPLPPDAPVYNAPANGAGGMSTSTVRLRWKAGLWAHKYDIYFGTSPTPPLLVADAPLGPSESSSHYITFDVPGPLNAGTTYYWKIVSKTMANKTKAGAVWSFSTGTSSSGGTTTGTLPSGWATRDIGGVAATGSASASGGTYTVRGSGADIWGTADEFRFAYKILTGDGSITARVGSITNQNAWSKAGVMMRETLTAGSKHATMFVSAGKGLAFQRRTSTNGTSTNTAGAATTAPYWVRVTRTGSTFRAYQSPDGSNWTLIGSATMNMTATIYVGLAVTSHADGAVATGTFTGVQ